MKTVVHSVFPHRRKERGVLTFALNSQNHHDIGAFDRVFNLPLNSQAMLDQFAKLARDERSGSGDANGRAQFGQQINVGTRDA